ncbi:RNA polymerase sigma factor [Kitasatospora sp. NPDC057223]|uniref:RNA polymerase sigma factor n=1 Tax=Kitasatospora sp. NPDC057223 TaxID=3346055 RepID=UPI00363C4578
MTCHGINTAPPTLIRQAQAGDPAAWTELYRTYRGPVLAYLWRRTADRALAEDLTQDTFVRAMRCIGGYRWTGTDIGAWFVTIARNLLVDHLKRRSTSRETVVAAVADSDSGVRVEAAVLAALDAARVGVAMGTLTDAQRRALRLRYWDGLTSREIAVATGLRVGAVKTLTYRARGSLRRALAPAV